MKSIIALLSFISIFSSCTLLYNPKTKGPPLPPNRVYTNITFDTMFNICETIFRNNEFKISDFNKSRGYFGTNWMESDYQNGLYLWKKRRRYHVKIEPDSAIKNRYYLIIEVEVQVKSPVGKWKMKKIDCKSDHFFQNILNSIDISVKKNNGAIA